MNVIIAGTRHNVDPKIVDEAIEESGFEVTGVISGAALGIDRQGEKWAQKRGIGVRSFPADWKAYGRAAGPMRNEEMAKVGDALIALPCKHSKGTLDMIQRAKRHQIPVFERMVPCMFGVVTGRRPVPKPQS